MIAPIEGNISNLKATRLSPTSIAIACTSEAGPDGKMCRPHKEPKPHSSARVYSSLYVRHWDAWKTPAHNTIWYGLLKLENGRYNLQEPGLMDALSGSSGLECPVPPLGGAGDFDIGPKGIAFVARDPELNPAYYTKSDLYFVPLEGFDKSPSAAKVVKTEGLRGYSGAPRFSHDGRRIAFVRMREVQYEADKTRLLVVPDVDSLGDAEEFYRTEDGEGGWDHSPSSITWSSDDSELYLIAEKHGKKVLWKLPSSPKDATSPPSPIFTAGSASHVAPLSKTSSTLLLTSNSLIESSAYSLLDPSTTKLTPLSSATKNGKALGLSPSQVSSTWFAGADDIQVHALVVKPSFFEEGKKYPLAFLVHGGPQGAWNEAWNTRWNPAVFAEQGYVVVAPNPTGSTGYGQGFTDAIKKEWGGRPYVDLVKCWEHVRDEMPFVDVENGVALGASYGGYMMSTSPILSHLHLLLPIPLQRGWT